MLQAANRLRATRLALGATIGVDGAVEARPTVEMEPAPLAYTDEELVDLALASAPRVVTAQAVRAESRAGLSVARTQYFPTLNASGTYSWNNTDLAFGGGRTSWNTRLSFSYSLFNGFGREEVNERAQLAVRGAEALVADATRRVRVDVATTLDDLRFAEQSIALTLEALNVAQEDMRVQEERYRLGASTILEHIQSQISLAQAEAALVNARFDYLIARARLESLVGRTL
jgi:outer membrane protein TolC